MDSTHSVQSENATLQNPDNLSPHAEINQKKPFRFDKYILLGILVFTLLGIFFFIQRADPHPKISTIPISPSPSVSSPLKRLSDIATTSSFIQLDQAISSLSASLNSFIIEDGTLTPPAIDLEINFTP